MLAGGTETECAVLDSWTLAPAAITGWAENAQAGARLPYARGWLPARSPAASAARHLRARGLVTFVQEPVPGGKLYIMERLRTAPQPLGRPRRNKSPRLDGDMSRVLRVLRQCAKANEACPPNAEIRKRSGVHNPSFAIQKLVDAKIVDRVVLDQASGARRVTILATGQKTALPDGWFE